MGGLRDRVPMTGGAANVATGGVGENANNFRGGLGRGAAFRTVPPNHQHAYGVGLEFQPMGDEEFRTRRVAHGRRVTGP